MGKGVINNPIPYHQTVLLPTHSRLVRTVWIIHGWFQSRLESRVIGLFIGGRVVLVGCLLVSGKWGG